MLPMWYISARRDVEAFFKPENKIGEIAKHTSPCKKYKLTVYSYQAVKNGSNYTRGIITRCADQITIADIKRSDEDFWFCWLSKSEKLLCGEDPYTHNLIDLNNFKITTYVDPKARSGFGFEWKEAKVNLNENLLAVRGKCMETLNTVTIYKIQELPMPIIKEKIFTQKIKIGWQNNNTLKINLPKKSITINTKG